MKKLTAMILALMLLLSVFTGCTKNQAEPVEDATQTPSAPEESVAETPAVPESPAAPEAPAATEESATTEDTTANEEPAVTEEPSEIEPPADPEAPDATEEPAAPEAPAVPEEPTVPETTDEPAPETPILPPQQFDLSGLIDSIYQINEPGLPVGTMPVDTADEFSLSYYTGLTDASLVKEAVVSEAMIGSQAYSLVLVQVNDSAKAASVAETMLNGIDQRKWICVEADDLRVVVVDDIIMLCMIDSKLDVKVDDMISAFSQVMGKAFSADLRK